VSPRTLGSGANTVSVLQQGSSTVSAVAQNVRSPGVANTSVCSYTDILVAAGVSATLTFDSEDSTNDDVKLMTLNIIPIVPNTIGFYSAWCLADDGKDGEVWIQYLTSSEGSVDVIDEKGKVTTRVKQKLVVAGTKPVTREQMALDLKADRAAWRKLHKMPEFDITQAFVAEPASAGTAAEVQLRLATALMRVLDVAKVTESELELAARAKEENARRRKTAVDRLLSEDSDYNADCHWPDDCKRLPGQHTPGTTCPDTYDCSTQRVVDRDAVERGKRTAAAMAVKNEKELERAVTSTSSVAPQGSAAPRAKTPARTPQSGVQTAVVVAPVK
jgi:hypothetical protein